MQTLLLKLWYETGKQVLLITHDIEEAVFMATELVLLSPGLVGCWNDCRLILPVVLWPESRAAALSPIRSLSPCASMC